MSILDRLRDSKKTSAFDARLRYLREKRKWDTSLIKEGVDEVCENLANGTKSLVVYGEPQSGKTEVMIALVCKLLDQKKKTIFVIMNDNTELEQQNFVRFKEAVQINPSPMKDSQFMRLPESDKRTDVPRVIFCRKNASILKKMITEARFLKDRLVLDDEADYASPNTKINKDQDPSRINELVADLGDLAPTGAGQYVGITATPGRLDLNGTFANDSKKWVFLRSHERYKGRQFFFPVSSEQKQASDYILKLLPGTGDDPKYLRDAFLRFLVRAAVVNLYDGKEEHPRGHSMLIHTEGKVSSHEEDQKQIQKHLSRIQNEQQPYIEKYLEQMEGYAQNEIRKYGHSFDSDNVLTFILEYIGKSSTLIINHKKENKRNVEEACNPKDVFTFAIGGNIVSRGLTFKNLLTFFFSRSVKNKFQQNTYIQRARMFGVRPYSKYFELCVPEDLFANWANCFADHEMSLGSAMAGDYVHISSSKTSPADSPSIDKSSTMHYHNEWRTGSVFPMPHGIEQRIAVGKNVRPIDLIQDLIESGVLPESGFKLTMLNIIREIANDNQSDVTLYIDRGGEFIYPGKYTDFREETITRKRGGLVAATMANRPEFDHKAIILPVKNKFGEMCFYYKNNLGKKVIKNIRSV